MFSGACNGINTVVIPFASSPLRLFSLPGDLLQASSSVSAILPHISVCKAHQPSAPQAYTPNYIFSPCLPGLLHLTCPNSLFPQSQLLLHLPRFHKCSTTLLLTFYSPFVPCSVGPPPQCLWTSASPLSTPLCTPWSKTLPPPS